MMTRTHIVAFILSLVVSAVHATRSGIARKYNLMDSPEDPRKVHQSPTPRLGGIAIALGFWSPLVALLVYNNDISTILSLSHWPCWVSDWSAAILAVVFGMTCMECARSINYSLRSRSYRDSVGWIPNRPGEFASLGHG